MLTGKSLTSAAEILQLAGAHHITVPPTLLKALAAERYDPATFVNTSLYDVLADISIPKKEDFENLLDDEAAFNTTLEAEDDGKLKQVPHTPACHEVSRTNKLHLGYRDIHPDARRTVGACGEGFEGAYWWVGCD